MPERHIQMKISNMNELTLSSARENYKKKKKIVETANSSQNHCKLSMCGNNEKFKCSGHETPNNKMDIITKPTASSTPASIALMRMNAFYSRSN